MNFYKICTLFNIIILYFFSLNLCFSSDNSERKREQPFARESPPKKNKSSHQQASEHQEQKSEAPGISTPDMVIVEKKIKEYKEILALCTKEDIEEIKKQLFFYNQGSFERKILDHVNRDNYVLAKSLLEKEIQILEQTIQKNKQQKMFQNILDKLKDVKRYDPPFFVLSTKDNRKVYVLGSIHSQNPKILLSNAVYEKLINILSNCTLFMEHDNQEVEKSLLKKIKNPAQPSTPWDPETIFSLSEGDIQKWNQIKDKKIHPNQQLIIGNMGSQTPTENTLFLYFRSRKILTTSKKNDISGFETTIKKIYKNPVLYLETPNEFTSSLSNDNPLIKSFFKIGIDNFFKEGSLETNNEFYEFRLIQEYKESFRKYDFNKYIYYDILDISTIQRNKIWPDKIKFYLESNTEEKPILIVCGARHLSGGSHNFLYLLLETKLFDENQIMRIDVHGSEKQITRNLSG